jgi:hypothetical protein
MTKGNLGQHHQWLQLALGTSIRGRNARIVYKQKPLGWSFGNYEPYTTTSKKTL